MNLMDELIVEVGCCCIITLSMVFEILVIFAGPNLAIETLEKGVKSVQSYH